MEWLDEELDLEEDYTGDNTDSHWVTKANWKQLFDEYYNRCQGEAPKLVRPVNRLLKDLEAMARIFEPTEPIHHLIQGEGINKGFIILRRCIGCWIWVIVGSWRWYHSFSIWNLGWQYEWLLVKPLGITKLGRHFEECIRKVCYKVWKFSYSLIIQYQRLPFSKDHQRVKSYTSWYLICGYWRARLVYTFTSFT